MLQDLAGFKNLVGLKYINHEKNNFTNQHQYYDYEL